MVTEGILHICTIGYAQVIQSPGYPDGYEDSKYDCVLTINVPEYSSFILTVDGEFNISTTGDCVDGGYLYIEVPSDTFIKCGSRANGTVLSTGTIDNNLTTVTIRFIAPQTASSDNNKFRIRYEGEICILDVVKNLYCIVLYCIV